MLSMWHKLNGKRAFCGPRDASLVRFDHPSVRLHKRHNFPSFHLPLNVLHPALSRHILTTYTCMHHFIYIIISNVIKIYINWMDDWIFIMWMLPHVSCRRAISIVQLAHINVLRVIVNDPNSHCEFDFQTYSLFTLCGRHKSNTVCTLRILQLPFNDICFASANFHSYSTQTNTLLSNVLCHFHLWTVLWIRKLISTPCHKIWVIVFGACVFFG